MLKRISKLRPTPATVMSFAALVISLGGAGYAATGGTFILGAANTASSQGSLSSNINGKTLVVSNPASKPKSTALGLLVAAGHPPLTVNSTGRVKNLNADLIDGLDSTSFPNVIRVSFNLAPGADSAPILIPPNTPVTVTGVVTTPGLWGVGSVSVEHAPGVALTWFGASYNETFVNGNNATSGHHIVWIDATTNVDLDVAGPDTIKVHNYYPTQVAGSVMLVY